MKNLLTPGLDNTRLFISLTAGAGTRSMIISLHYQAFVKVRIVLHDMKILRKVPVRRENREEKEKDRKSVNL